MLIPERKFCQESKLARERKAFILKSKFQEQGITAWDFKKAVKRMAAKYLENAFSSQTSACCSWSHLPYLLPSNFQGSMALSVLNDSHSVQLRKSPPSPAGSPGNCLEVSFFLEVAWLPTGREGGCLWSWEHSPGWTIHAWWAAHMVTGSHGSMGHLCSCVLAIWLALNNHNS